MTAPQLPEALLRKFAVDRRYPVADEECMAMAAELLAERDAARAEVERVAKQRDEARSVAQHVVELIDDGGSSADVWNLCARWSYNWAGSEQPKPAGGA